MSGIIIEMDFWSQTHSLWKTPMNDLEDGCMCMEKSQCLDHCNRMSNVQFIILVTKQVEYANKD